MQIQISSLQLSHFKLSMTVNRNKILQVAKSLQTLAMTALYLEHSFHFFLVSATFKSSEVHFLSSIFIAYEHDCLCLKNKQNLFQFNEWRLFGASLPFVCFFLCVCVPLSCFSNISTKGTILFIQSFKSLHWYNYVKC